MRLILTLTGLHFWGGILSASTSSREARFDWVEYRGSNPVNASLSAPPDTYRNPILAGFYPDPSILRVGSDYYLVNSSFGYFPGLPVFHSRDLVHWTQIGNALSRPEQIKLMGGNVSQGLYAPALRFNQGTFYIINKHVGGGGIYFITAKDPAGPWSDPVWLKSVPGFDPSIFFDRDGTCYVIVSQRAAKPRYQGHTGIWAQQWDLIKNEPVGALTLLLDGGVNLGSDPYYAEGPHLFRRGEWYYLSVAQGGTERDHAQVILRSRAPLGPYESYAGNPILTQVGLPADRPFPISATGHADMVETENGDWWAVFLGTEPYADDFYNTGRQTFLLPVRWTNDDWPIILPQGQAVPHVVARPRLPNMPEPKVPNNGDFTVRDEFAQEALAPYWMMLRTPESQWWRMADGGLVLQARAFSLGSQGNPSYLGRRQQHMNMQVTTRVHFVPAYDGDRAGLALFQSEGFYFFFGLGQDDGRTVIKLERRAGRKDPAFGVSGRVQPARSGRVRSSHLTFATPHFDPKKLHAIR